MGKARRGAKARKSTGKTVDQKANKKKAGSVSKGKKKRLKRSELKKAQASSILDNLSDMRNMLLAASAESRQTEALQIRSSKARRRAAVGELNQLKAVQHNPAFQLNALQALHEHISNKLKLAR